MSYDLKIYTVNRQNYEDLLDKFNILINEEGFILPLKKSQIMVSNAVQIEDEDIPTQISRELPGIQYLIECHLEPFTDNKKLISELLKLAKLIAQNWYGVIENPQTDDIILPSGTRRVQEIKKTERFSIIELSWWFNNDILRKRENINYLLQEIERTVPEALPRRYGVYEPPKEKFSDIDEFASFLVENLNDSIVWYPTKPVVSVSLSVPPVIGPTKMGYRFGHFSIEIDSAVLSMPGWRIIINRLFKNISQVLCPFYGDIRIINDYIRSRNGAWIDGKTEHHPIDGWWWNGLPHKSGLGLVLGNPLLDYVNMERECLLLKNGCKLILTEENDAADKLYEGIEIPNEILQPKRMENPRVKVYGFTGLYPKLWPFKGPKSDQ